MKPILCPVSDCRPILGLYGRHLCTRRFRSPKLKPKLGRRVELDDDENRPKPNRRTLSVSKTWSGETILHVFVALLPLNQLLLLPSDLLSLLFLEFASIDGQGAIMAATVQRSPAVAAASLTGLSFRALIGTSRPSATTTRRWKLEKIIEPRVCSARHFRTSAKASREIRPETVEEHPGGKAPEIKRGASKLFKSADEAVADIQSGSVILSAGFGLCGTAGEFRHPRSRYHVLTSGCRNDYHGDEEPRT